MAVELVPFRWDDLDLMQDPPVKTPSAATVRFSSGRSGEMEVDLSAEHLKAYEQVVDPMLAAARPVRKDPAASRPEPGTRRDEFWSGLREWARAAGIKVDAQVNGQGKKAGYKYPVALVRQYEDYLAMAGDAHPDHAVH